MKISKTSLLAGLLLGASQLARAQATTASLLDLTTNTVISNFVVGRNPQGIAWSGNNLAYVSNEDDNTLVRVDMTTSPPTITSTFTFPEGYLPIRLHD